MYARRYATLGALFGLTFPVIGTGVEALAAHGGLALAALAAAQGSPLLWIVDSAPLFLGLFPRMAGEIQRAAGALAGMSGDLDRRAQAFRARADEGA